MRPAHFAIVGATGAVGEKMLQVLEHREVPVAGIRLAATSRSAGSKVPWKGQVLEVEDIESFDFHGVDYALFAGGEVASREHAERAGQAGAIVIDNSSEFRMDPAVPLVVPEVNGHLLDSRPKLIANPNCSTVQMVVVLEPFLRFGLKRVMVSTYQSVSGTGRPALAELDLQARALLEGGQLKAEVYPHPIAENLFPHIGSFADDGFSGEERKMIDETKKILERPDLAVSATCVRVPVRFAHSETLYLEVESELTLEDVVSGLKAKEGVELFERPEDYPTPLSAQERDIVQVGRIRRDPDVAGGWHLWVVADNLRKGAATNAIQIAERLMA